MADVAQGPGWYQASDGRWYPAVPPQAKKRRKWPWVLGIIGGVFILFIVLVVAAIGGAVHQLDTEEQSHAISHSQFASITLGTSQPQVQSELGKTPQNTQQFVSQGVLNQSQLNSSCIYYNEAGDAFGTYYQFCFQGDRLSSKAAY